MRFTMVLIEVRSGLPGFTGHYSEGVASITAVLRRAGHQVTLIHLTRPTSPEIVAERIAATSPDVIGYSTMTHTFGYLARIAPAVRRRLPGVPTILGGVHAILSPAESIAVEGIDLVCLGEGESLVLPLLDRVAMRASLADLEGAWVKEGGRVFRNPARPLITDLDSLPPPDRTVFDFGRLVSTREGVLYVFASRGCPYACPFCSNGALRAAAPNPGKYLRRKSVARTCDEIERAAPLFPGPIRGVYFQDEILGLDRRWLGELAEVYPARIGIPWNCNLRADNVTDHVADLLARAGCTSVSIGLESGVERLRRTVVGKDIGDEVFHRAFDRLAARGIAVHTFNMVGLPGERPEDALSTAFFNAEARVDRSMVSIFCPYPGTPLHAEVVASGLLGGPLPDTYQDETPLAQRTISARQVRFLHDFFGEIVALRRSRLGARIEAPLTRLVRRDGPELAALSAIKRAAKRTLSAPYLAVGRLLFNRQARVFRKTARPRS